MEKLRREFLTNTLVGQDILCSKWSKRHFFVLTVRAEWSVYIRIQQYYKADPTE